MPHRTDAELCARCREGDESAWTVLVDRYAALIYSIPRRYRLSAAASDDVFSDVCLALVRALPGLRDAQALPQWLIRTTTRATWEAARKARRKPPEDLPPLTGAAPPDAFVAMLEEEQQVRAALREISQRCRELLELLYFAEPAPSYDDVAARMGMARGSIGPTRRRCLEKMRTHLEKPLGGVSGTRGSPPRE